MPLSIKTKLAPRPDTVSESIPDSVALPAPNSTNVVSLGACASPALSRLPMMLAICRVCLTNRVVGSVMLRLPVLTAAAAAAAAGAAAAAAGAAAAATAFSSIVGADAADAANGADDVLGSLKTLSFPICACEAEGGSMPMLNRASDVASSRCARHESGCSSCKRGVAEGMREGTTLAMRRSILLLNARMSAGLRGISSLPGIFLRVSLVLVVLVVLVVVLSLPSLSEEKA